MTRLLYFAWVRERVGVAEEALDLPPALVTVDDLLDWLATRSPGHAAALADRSAVRVGVDQDFARGDAPIAGAVEIAIFPPVTGGDHFALPFRGGPRDAEGGPGVGMPRAQFQRFAAELAHPRAGARAPSLAPPRMGRGK